MAIKKGLGKGLDSLIPSGILDGESDIPKTKAESAEPEGKEQMVRISKVEPNRDQPRKKFDEDSLDELADSIRQFGIIQPLLVQKKGDHYEIVAGERRWRAAKIAGLKEVPVLVREYTDQEIMEIALIENIQRENLNPIEEAQAYQRLIEEFHVKHEEIADRVSKSRSFITNSMRLLKLDPKVQEMVVEGLISGGHARTILPLSPEQQCAMAQKIVDEDLSVRETENAVKNLQKEKPAKAKPGKSRNQLFYDELAKTISEKILTKVKIKDNGNNKGKIEISYYSLEELERIQKILEK